MHLNKDIGRQRVMGAFFSRLFKTTTTAEALARRQMLHLPQLDAALAKMITANRAAASDLAAHLLQQLVVLEPIISPNDLYATLEVLARLAARMSNGAALMQLVDQARQAARCAYVSIGSQQHHSPSHVVTLYNITYRHQPRANRHTSLFLAAGCVQPARPSVAWAPRQSPVQIHQACVTRLRRCSMSGHANWTKRRWTKLKTLLSHSYATRGCSRCVRLTMGWWLWACGEARSRFDCRSPSLSTRV